MNGKSRLIAFAAFTSVFIVLAALVFWGCWSQDVAFVARDDLFLVPKSYGMTLTRWVNNFITTGRAQPTDLFWSGLFVSPVFCWELKYASAMYLSGLALAFFLRGRGLSLIASYAAGLFLSFSGYWVTLYSAGHAGWFIWMSYGVFAFGLIDRLFTRGKLVYGALLGACVAWGCFYQPDLWMIWTMMTGVYFLFRGVWTFRSQKTCPWKGVLLAAVAFVLIGLPGFYQALHSDVESRDEQIKASSSARGNESDARWRFVTDWSMPLEDAVEFAIPRYQGDTKCNLVLSINAKKGVRPYTGKLGSETMSYRQHSLYVGFVTCLFALIGIIACVKGHDRSTVLFFAFVALVTFSLSLGRNFESFYRLFYAMPYGDYLRAPVKWHHLTEFCLCVLSGYGVERVMNAVRDGRLQRVIGGAVIAIVLCGAANEAWEAKRFCAPVNMKEAIRRCAVARVTEVSLKELEAPGIREMCESGLIRMVAPHVMAPNRAAIVQVLEPQKRTKLKKIETLPLSFGIVSVLAAIGVGVMCVRRKA